MYYRPKGAVSADVIPYYENGTYYLFYLRDYRDVKNHGEGCPWHLVTTTDFVNYTEQGQMLQRGTVADQDLYVFTGSVFKHESTYYIFYTGHNPHLMQKGQPQEKIMLASSPDLLSWTKLPDFEMSAPPHLEEHDFRDPFVYYDEQTDTFKMLLAARKKCGPINRRGVTVAATSKNLLDWKIEKTAFYEPDRYFTHECPDLFRMGEWYYLVFSEFTDKVVTKYCMSKSPDGPWTTPQVDSFDGHCFYAAKSVAGKDGKRYLLGWNCITDGERDYEPWQWGGTIIPHEIVQQKDGTLWVKCPDNVAENYCKEVALTPSEPLGACVCQDGKYVLGGDGKAACVLLGKMPERCKITAHIEAEGSNGDFGIMLRSDREQNAYYTVKIEPLFNRLCFDRMPRRLGYQHCMIESERYLSSALKTDVTVIVEGTVAEVYVNDKVAMSVRMFDFKQGELGLYSAGERVSFDNVKMYKEERE